MLITARSATSPAILGRFLIATFVLSSVMATSCSREAANQQAAGVDSAGGASARGGRGGGRGGGGAPVPVVTGHSVSKPMPVTIPAVGTAEPLVTVQVRAQVTGQLSRVHFREGQDVNKGDTLLALDSRPFEAALRQAEAVLARDTAQSKNAQAQQTRYKELFDRGLIPRDQYETQSATASALEATLAADLSQVENARLSLQYATIKAPISGRTGALAVHEGDLIRASKPAGRRCGGRNQRQRRRHDPLDIGRIRQGLAARHGEQGRHAKRRSQRQRQGQCRNGRGGPAGHDRGACDKCRGCIG